MLQNPKRTNPERSDGPQHSHSYCFAMGVPFIPCFFQSAQYLDPSGREELKRFIALYKKHREAIFNCYTFPIGNKPDNQSWSGFQMTDEQNNKGYILLFRELHNKDAHKGISLKFLANKNIMVTNLETGKVSQQKVPGNGDAVFSIKDPATYLFLQYSVKNKK
jgi:alpha-galactosidase